jgi:hypothetical protein
MKKFRVVIRVLGLLLVCGILWGFAGCEQSPGNTGSVEEEEEEQEEPEEEEQEQPEQPEEPEPVPAVLRGILIGSPPDLLFYALGQSFDPAGLIVEGLYDDDTSRPLEAGEYTLDTPDTSLSGARQVRVSAGDYTASFPIMVNNSVSVLNSISIDAPAEGLVRYLGQALGTEGFTVTGHYTEGDQVLSMFSVRGYDRAKRGPQTVTLSVNGKSAELPVVLKVPADAAVSAMILGMHSVNPISGRNTAFIKGQSLNLANHRFWASVTCNNVTATLFSGAGIDVETEIHGFDSGTPGKQQITLNLDEHAPIPLEVYVADIEPAVYFDYGFMRHGGDPEGWGTGSGRTEGCYHTQPGKKVVLSPVRFLIGFDRDSNDLGAAYSWTVTPRGGTTASYTAPELDGEFLTFTPSGGGTWDVSVTVTGRNFVDGSTISRSATTALICDTGPLPAGASYYMVKNFSPG